MLVYILIAIYCIFREEEVDELKKTKIFIDSYTHNI